MWEGFAKLLAEDLAFKWREWMPNPPQSLLGLPVQVEDDFRECHPWAGDEKPNTHALAAYKVLQKFANVKLPNDKGLGDYVAPAIASALVTEPFGPKEKEIVRASLFSPFIEKQKRKFILYKPPRILWVDGRIHSTEGPAVFMPGKEITPLAYVVRGIQISSDMWTTLKSGKLTKKAFTELRGRNAELLSAILEILPPESLARLVEASLVSKDEWGELYSVQIPGFQEVKYVLVTNSTPEPDGSFKKAILWVPPNIKTPHEGIAATFGLRTTEYHPKVQT